jgi:choice-of-anchor B domain-containing protein
MNGLYAMSQPRIHTGGPTRRGVLSGGTLLLAALLSTVGPLQAQQLYDFGTAFGRAAAVVGDELLVAQPQNVINPGRVYVYEASARGWTETQALTAPGAERADGFGRALAGGGDALLIGAPKEAEGAGAAHLFRRVDGAWRAAARIGATSGATMAGSAVAASGALVALVERRDGSEVVRIFRWTGSTLEAEGEFAGEPGDGRFGAALAALDANHLAVCGADDTGAAVLDLLGRDSNGQWSTVVRVRPGAPLSAPGGLLSQDPYKECGLAAADGRLAIGTPLAPGGGAVTVYRVEQGNGLQVEFEATLAPPSGAGGRFGTSVGVADGPSVWVGAPNAGGLLGAAVRFSGADGAWDAGTVLNGPGEDFMPVFGLALAAGGTSAVVGSPGDDYGAGVAVSYRHEGGGWVEAGELAGEVEGYEAVTGEAVDCMTGTAALFGCDQMDLVAMLPVEAMGASRGAMVNDVWGWTDPETRREYAVVGRSEGTSFVDVTDPGQPIYLGQLLKTEGSRGNAWRDVKVLNDHALIVADNAGQHGMQVFDLTRLRDADPADPPTFEADAIYTDIASSHNLAVNEETGFVYAMASSGGGRACGSLHMIDLRDPKNPTFAGCYTDPSVGLGASGQTHDAQCVLYHGPDDDFAGREICFAFAESAVSIGDVTDKDAPVIVSKAVMPNTAYIHQGWLTEDHRYLYVNDELDEMNGLTEGTRTMIWDVQDLGDPVLAGLYIADNNATDHNLYVSGTLMYQSNYAAGLRVIDVSDPENPREVAWFDTAPYADEVPGFFDGSWSNYPFFPSGNILVTSHKQGLFVLKRRRPIS